MNQEPFDSSWRDRLDQHETPINTDLFWTGLEPHLPKPEKKRRFGLIWWPLAFGFLVAIGYYTMNPATKTDSVDALPESRLSPSKPKQPEASMAIVPDQLNTNLSPQPAEQSDSGTSPSESTASSSAMVLTKNSVPAASANLETIPPGDQGARKGNNTITPASIGPLAISPPKGHEVADQPVEGKVSNEARNLNVGNKNDVHATRQQLLMQPASIGRLTLGELVVASAFRLPSVPSQPVIPDMPSSPKKKHQAWSVDFQTGPGISSQGYKDVTELATTLISNRKATESPLESWSTAMHGRWTSKSGAFMQVGVAHTRMNSRLDWNNKAETNRWGLANGFILEANGTMTPWEDSAWIVYNEVREVRHYNRIDILDIPMAVGYQWDMNEWCLDGALGILLNLSQSAKGRSLGLDGLPAYWASTPSLTYAKRLDLGYLAQARLTWKPSGSWGVFVQPLIQFRPSGHVDNDETGYNIRSWSGFLQFGTAYSF